MKMNSRHYLFVLACALTALLAACGSGGSNNASNGTKNTNQAKGNTIPANAPVGAQPPTQTGSPTATVTIEEFADFQCPQCAAKNPVLSEIRSMYGSRIRFIFRSFPLDIPAHDKAYDAALAAQAAYAQGKFWEMEALLFNNQRNWTSDPNYKQIWKGYAQQIGLDVNKWEDDCLGLPAKQRVDDDKKRAQGVGVSSTPTVYLNNVEYPFEKLNVDELKAAIDAALAKAGPPQPAAPAANTSNSGNSANAAPAK